MRNKHGSKASSNILIFVKDWVQTPSPPCSRLTSAIGKKIRLNIGKNAIDVAMFLESLE